MRSPSAGRCSISGAIALVTIVCAGGARAQDTPLPAVAGAAALRARAAVPGQVRRPSLAEIMAKGGITQDVINRRRADPNEKPLPAVSAAAFAPAPRLSVPQRKPSVDELVQKIRSLPGGAEQLDRAQRARGGSPGEHVVRDGTAAVDEPRLGGPYVPAPEDERGVSVGPVYASPNAGSGEQSATGGTLAIQLDSGQSVMSYPGYDAVWHLYSLSDETHRPVVRYRIFIPTTGWYIINVDATSTPYARLRTLEEGKWIGIATSWGSYPNTPNTALTFPPSAQTYPVLLNLAAGIHVFEWFLTAPPGTLMQSWFFDVSVTQW